MNSAMSASADAPAGHPKLPHLSMPPRFLYIMHDFEARSPDELTLLKGETVEVLEGDDEFNDGWYRGRCTKSNQEGLFPQVYTSPNPPQRISQQKSAGGILQYGSLAAASIDAIDGGDKTTTSTQTTTIPSFTQPSQTPPDSAASTVSSFLPTSASTDEPLSPPFSLQTHAQSGTSEASEPAPIAASTAPAPTSKTSLRRTPSHSYQHHLHLSQVPKIPTTGTFAAPNKLATIPPLMSPPPTGSLPPPPVAATSENVETSDSVKTPTSPKATQSPTMNADAALEKLNMPVTAGGRHVVQQPPSLYQSFSHPSLPPPGITRSTSPSPIHVPPPTLAANEIGLASGGSSGGPLMSPEYMRSPVVEDTLSDIEEAISEFGNSPRHSSGYEPANLQPPHAAHRRSMSAGALGPGGVYESLVNGLAMNAAEREQMEHRRDIAGRLGISEQVVESGSDYDAFRQRQESDEEARDADEEEMAEENGVQLGAPSTSSVGQDEGLDSTPSESGTFSSAAPSSLMDQLYTYDEVANWTPEQVSTYLSSRRIGADICERFVAEEVDGKILLQLEMSHLKELEIGRTFGKRFEVWKEIESLGKIVKPQKAAPHQRRSEQTATSRKETSEDGRARSNTHTGGARPPSRTAVYQRQHPNLHVNVPDNVIRQSGDSGWGLTPPHTGNSRLSAMSSADESSVGGRSPRLSGAAAEYAKNHSRRHSSVDLSFVPGTATGLNAAMGVGAAVLAASDHPASSLYPDQLQRERDPRTYHTRQSSFDRSWTNVSAGSPASPAGPLSPNITKPTYVRPGTATGHRAEFAAGHKASTSSETGTSRYTGDSGFGSSSVTTTISSGSHRPNLSIDRDEKSYFSSGEASTASRTSIFGAKNVLHKKNPSTASAGSGGGVSLSGHRRKSSYTEEQRLRSGTAHSRHSRVGSADTVRALRTVTGTAVDALGIGIGSGATSGRDSPSPASIIYHSKTSKRKESGDVSGPETYLSASPSYPMSSKRSTSRAGAASSPIVTIGSPYSPVSPMESPSLLTPDHSHSPRTSSLKSPVRSPSALHEKRLPPLQSPPHRAASENIIGHQHLAISPIDGKSSHYVQSPASIGEYSILETTITANSINSGTNSTGASTIQSKMSVKFPGTHRSTSTPNPNAPRLRSMGSSGALRQKSKKQLTTAWREGLREITPARASKDADFCGWMKKRGSSTMVAKWSMRYFVLKGRRLSYFYNEHDTKERGLIDITSHRVLAATGEKFVNLSASMSNSAPPQIGPPPPEVGSPTAPSTLPPAPTGPRPGGGGWFVYKLVPPAPGASKGVMFTPPRTHYFATPHRDEGRRWMAAMMKATIDRDESKPVISSYNANTISLKKARELKARPVELMNDEQLESYKEARDKLRSESRIGHPEGDIFSDDDDGEDESGKLASPIASGGVALDQLGGPTLLESLQKSGSEGWKRINGNGNGTGVGMVG